MATTDNAGPTCPECGTEVQSTWRWCLACGHDPDGLRPQALSGPHGGRRARSASRPAKPPRQPRFKREIGPAAPSRLAADAATPLATSIPALPPPPPPAPETSPPPGVAAPTPVAPRAPFSVEFPDPVASTVGDRARPQTRERLPLLIGAGIVLFGIILVGAILRQNNEPVAAPKVANPQGGVRTATPWARFTPPEGGFSIDLPGSALAYVQDTTLGGTSIRVRHFSALGSANTVTVSYADLLPDTEALGDERRIEGFAAEQANEMGAVATNSRPSVVDGHKTLDYTIAAKGAGTSMSRVILVGNRIYNIAIIGTSPKAEYFVKATSSFAIG